MRCRCRSASLIRDHMLEAIAHGKGEADWSAVADVERAGGGY